MKKWTKNSLYCIVSILVFLLSMYITIDVLLKTQETTICPDVRGKTVEEAKRTAKKQGVRFNGPALREKNDVPYHHITVQKPDADIAIRKGKIFHVIVSENPQFVEVSGLVGQPFEKAAERLSEKFITIKKT